MLHIPIARWGEPYKSLEADKIYTITEGQGINNGTPFNPVPSIQ